MDMNIIAADLAEYMNICIGQKAKYNIDIEYKIERTNIIVTGAYRWWCSSRRVDHIDVTYLFIITFGATATRPDLDGNLIENEMK